MALIGAGNDLARRLLIRQSGYQQFHDDTNQPDHAKQPHDGE
jgi:hypothetical protein